LAGGHFLNHASQPRLVLTYLIMIDLGRSGFPDFGWMMRRIGLGQPVGDNFVACFFADFDHVDGGLGNQAESNQRYENSNHGDHNSLSQFHFRLLSRIFVFIA
jgi:hypothetical protein